MSKRTDTRHIPASLHTVKAATNVAREALRVAADSGRRFVTADNLADAALTILGYENAMDRTDPIVATLVANCAKLLAETRAEARHAVSVAATSSAVHAS